MRSFTCFIAVLVVPVGLHAFALGDETKVTEKAEEASEEMERMADVTPSP